MKTYICKTQIKSFHNTNYSFPYSTVCSVMCHRSKMAISIAEMSSGTHTSTEGERD